MLRYVFFNFHFFRMWLVNGELPLCTSCHMNISKSKYLFSNYPLLLTLLFSKVLIFCFCVTNALFSLTCFSKFAVTYLWWHTCQQFVVKAMICSISSGNLESLCMSSMCNTKHIPMLLLSKLQLKEHIIAIMKPFVS